MSDPWFDPNTYSWIPGTLFGTALGVCGGGLGGPLSASGKLRWMVTGMQYFFLLVAVALLLAGGIAFFTGQPYGIWYALTLPGLLGVILTPVMIRTFHHNYAAAEERKMTSRDMMA